MNQRPLNTNVAGRYATHAGQFSDAVGLFGCDLLLRPAGAGDGLQDGSAGGIGGDSRVADDEEQGAAFPDMMEVCVDLGNQRNIRCRQNDAQYRADQCGGTRSQTSM